MNADKCIKRIIDETRTRLTKEEVGAVVRMLLEYQTHPRNKKVFGPFSPEQGVVMGAIENAPQGSAIGEARDILIARAKLVLAQQEANVVMDAAKRSMRMATYNAAPDAYLGLKAKLVGSNHAFQGARDSAAAAMQGNTHELLGTFDRELKAAGLVEVFRSDALADLWARELYELNRTQGGRPGITGNKQAAQIAQAVHNMQRRGVEMVNREGAFVGRYDGYISRTSHSPYRMNKMGVDAWVELAKTTFDIPTIYPNKTAAEVDKALRDQFARIRSGLHDSYDPAELDLITYAGGQNRAKRVSESRSIHFADADSWLRYMKEAGERTPSQIVLNSAQQMARDAGLMRVWGTNPARAMEVDMTMLRQQARDTGNVAMGEQLDRKQRQLDLWMSYLTGEANHVVNQTWAAVTSNVLAVQRMAKLGFLPFAQLTDVAASMSELRYQGVGFLDRVTAGVTAYFRGAKGSDKREVADLLNAYLEGELTDYNAGLELHDPIISGTFTGKVNKLQQLFFKYTGAAAMTNRARGSVMYMMARSLGTKHGVDFAGLGAEQQRLMSMFNIGEHEWNALSQADWTTGLEGKRYLVPRDALTIPDHAADAYNQATGNTFEYDTFKQDMAHRLYSFYADRMNYGVLQPTVEEQAMLSQGYASDTAQGIALRLVTQFKSFMVASFTKTWGREIYGGTGVGGAAAGLAEYAAYGTVLGIASNALTQLAKGQDPSTQWEKYPAQAVTAGFLRAGTASMLGDFLFGDFSRHGQSLAGYLTGPTIGSLETFSRAYSSAVRGENPAGDLLSFVRGVTPLTNVFYTKMAVDYLIWNNLSELAAPGYLKRAQKRLKEKQGIEYLNAPFDMSPNAMRAFK